LGSIIKIIKIQIKFLLSVFYLCVQYFPSLNYWDFAILKEGFFCLGSWGLFSCQENFDVATWKTQGFEYLPFVRERAPFRARIFILFIDVEAFLLKAPLFFFLKERARIQVLGFSMLQHLCI